MSEEPSHRRLRSLVGLALMAALFGGVWFVVSELRRSAALQAVGMRAGLAGRPRAKSRLIPTAVDPFFMGQH